MLSRATRWHDCETTFEGFQELNQWDQGSSGLQTSGSIKAQRSTTSTSLHRLRPSPRTASKGIETENVTPALSVHGHVHPLRMPPASPESGRPENGAHVDSIRRIHIYRDMRLDHRSYHLCILLHRSRVISSQLAAARVPGHRSRRGVVKSVRHESQSELDADELATSGTLAYGIPRGINALAIACGVEKIIIRLRYQIGTPRIRIAA